MFVEELTSESSGSWLVTTQGSQHIFNFDNFFYKRMPQDSSSGSFHYDNLELKISRIEIYPKVNSKFYIFVDDLDFPNLLEHWRISSKIVSIQKISGETDEQSL